MPVTFALVAAAAGTASAVLQAAPLSGSLSAIALWFFSQLPLFLVGLSMGVGAGALAAVIATVLLAAFSGVVFTVQSIALHAAPAVLMTRQALLNRPAPGNETEWYPVGNLLVLVIGVAATLFLAAVLWNISGGEGLEALLRERVAAEFRSVTLPPDWSGPSIADLTAAIARLLPATSALGLIAMVIVNGVVAQGILQRLGRNLRPNFDFRTLELPGWYHVATAIAVIGMVFGGTAGFVGFNLLMIFSLGYFVQGLAVIHTIVAAWNQKYLWLTAVYILFVILGPAAVLVMLLGAIEPWAQLRRRFAALPSPWR